MDACRLPLIARLNGHALAGGFGLACACDLVVAREDALIGVPEVRGRAVPDDDPALPACGCLPYRTLMELCLTGEPITAAEAAAARHRQPRRSRRRTRRQARVRCSSASSASRRAASGSANRRWRRSARWASTARSNTPSSCSPTWRAREDAREGFAAFNERRAAALDGGMTMARAVRIGCGAGFWGDSPEGPAQLVRSGGIDYLVLDYLAEITMSILARMRAKNPDARLRHGFRVAGDEAAGARDRREAHQGRRQRRRRQSRRLPRRAGGRASREPGVDLKVADRRGRRSRGARGRIPRAAA